MPYPYDQEPEKPSLLQRVATGAGTVAALGGAGILARGLAKNGFTKENLRNPVGTFRSGLGALKRDAVGVRRMLRGAPPGVVARNASAAGAELSARTARLRELTASVDGLVAFDQDASGRFVAKPKEKSSAATATKVVAGTLAAGAGLVAGRGLLDGKTGSAVFKAGVDGLRRDVGNAGKTIRAIRRGVPLRQTAIGRDVLRAGKAGKGVADLITGYGSGAIVKGRAK